MNDPIGCLQPFKQTAFHLLYVEREADSPCGEVRNYGRRMHRAHTL